MEWIEAIILALIQGLTEFIPVSSSGHIVAVQNILPGASDRMFVEYINIGTTLALFIYFRKKIAQLFRDVFRHKNFTLARNILLTSVPAGAAGFFFADFIGTNAFFAATLTVIVTLVVVGILLIIVEKLPKASAIKDGAELSKTRATMIGIAQMTALIPGVSRSGATILAGRFAGLKPAEAAEYSFLASLPIMVGVTLKLFVSDYQYLLDNAAIVTVSNLVAFLSGLLAVGLLMRYLANHSLAIFGWYRIFLAGVLAVFLLVQ